MKSELEGWAEDGLHSDCERKIHRLKRSLREAKAVTKSALEDLELEERRVEFLLALGDPKPVPIRARTRKAGAHECVAVAVASDWHIEERVFPEEVNGDNEYGIEVAKIRAARFFRAIAWKIAHLQAAGKGGEGIRLRRLFLAVIGDIITGNIHEELAETNDLTPLEAKQAAFDIFVSGLDYLEAECDLPEGIDIHWSWGNHGRLTKKSRVKNQRKHNLEWDLGHQVAKHYAKSDRIRVHVARKNVEVRDILGWKVRLTHGDSVKYGGGIGGLAVPLSKKVLRWDAGGKADLTIIGHFHTLTHLGQPHVVVNGSLIGPSEYSDWIAAAPEEPAQAFFCIDRERGLRFWDPIRVG